MKDKQVFHTKWSSAYYLTNPLSTLDIEVNITETLKLSVAIVVLTYRSLATNSISYNAVNEAKA